MCSNAGFNGAMHLLNTGRTKGRLNSKLPDKGDDANWFREGLIRKKFCPCIPPKKNRKIQMEHDKLMCKQRHKVENMLGRLQD